MLALATDVFLLMLNLARLRDRAVIVRTFVDALRVTRAGLEVRHEASDAAAADAVAPVATSEHTFGHIVFGGSFSGLPAQDQVTLRNAVMMLAVVLENRVRAERLESENARLDAAVAERTRTLEDTARELQQMYDEAPIGYHSVGADARLLKVNATECRWLGYAPEELVGRSLLDIVPDRHRGSVRDAVQRLIREGVLRDLEIELVRKDGSLLPVQVNASAARDADGRFVMSRSTLVDLTERRKVEAQLRDAEQRARQAQKLEAIGRLAGGVAHDFNNLLTVILSGVTFLQEGLAPSDPRAADLQDVRDAAERGSVLTRQLLTFSRRQVVQATTIELGGTLQALPRMLRRLIGEDVELVTAFGEGVPRVCIDVGQLEQVVVNLVVNARDAVGPGGHLTVETRAVEAAEAALLQLPGTGTGRWAQLAVHDDGCGMDERVQARLFEPFFTTKEAGKGTGLGLATVYGIVKQAGGEIRVESRPGEGSHFRVFLPEGGSAAELGPQAESSPRPRGEGVVLLVEDEPRVRELSARALRASGFTVVEAGDGPTALARAREVRPALAALVTDVVMPGMGGEVLARAMREERPGLPTLFISGYPDRAAPFQGPADDRQAFLQKPFTPEALSRKVIALLQGS